MNKPIKYRCLIDADLIVYGSAFANQRLNDDGVIVAGHFDRCIENIDERVKLIEEECFADLPSMFIFTGDKTYERMHNQLKQDNLVIKPNFRHDIATLLPYKGNRKKTDKPLHYDNVKAYMLSKFNYLLSNGCEADDLLAQLSEMFGSEGIDRGDYIERVIICSVDKDLRIQAGWHYSPASYNSPSKPLELIDRFGYLKDVGEDKLKVVGGGVMFHYYQMLIGDSTDNIIGCGIQEKAVYKSGKKKGQEYTKRKGVGARTAFDTLKDCMDETELLFAVADRYYSVYGETWKEAMLENARLLFMANKKDENGNLIMWDFPEEIDMVEGTLDGK